MKLKNPMIIVTDLENSKKFYKRSIGLRVIMDFGANITLTGGLCLQTKDSWLEFINASDKDISFWRKTMRKYILKKMILTSLRKGYQSLK